MDDVGGILCQWSATRVGWTVCLLSMQPHSQVRIHFNFVTFLWEGVSNVRLVEDQEELAQLKKCYGNLSVCTNIFLPTHTHTHSLTIWSVCKTGRESHLCYRFPSHHQHHHDSSPHLCDSGQKTHFVFTLSHWMKKEKQQRSSIEYKTEFSKQPQRLSV